MAKRFVRTLNCLILVWWFHCCHFQEWQSWNHTHWSMPPDHRLSLGTFSEPVRSAVRKCLGSHATGPSGTHGERNGWIMNEWMNAWLDEWMNAISFHQDIARCKFIIWFLIYVIKAYPQLLRVWNGCPPGVWRSEVWNGRLTIVDLFHLDHFRPFYAFTCMMMILDLWILRFWNFGNLGWILGIWIFWSFRIWILGDLDFGNLDLLRMLWIWDFFL